MYLSVSSTYRVSLFTGWSIHMFVCTLFFLTWTLRFCLLKSIPLSYLYANSLSSSISIIRCNYSTAAPFLLTVICELLKALMSTESFLALFFFLSPPKLPECIISLSLLELPSSSLNDSSIVIVELCYPSCFLAIPFVFACTK